MIWFLFPFVFIFNSHTFILYIYSICAIRFYCFSPFIRGVDFHFKTNIFKSDITFNSIILYYIWIIINTKQPAICLIFWQFNKNKMGVKNWLFKAGQFNIFCSISIRMLKSVRSLIAISIDKVIRGCIFWWVISYDKTYALQYKLLL